MQRIKYSFLLVLAALIWGAAFSAQSAGMDYVGPFTFNGIRSLIGGIVLLPVIFVIDGSKKKKKAPITTFKQNLPAGIICGLLLFLASSLQQVGINLGTSAGKAGFITALYVILVPIISLFFGKKSKFTLWISAAMAVVGMYFLCLSGDFTLQLGDLLIFLCAIVFSFHILVIDKYSPSLDGVKISSLQFFTTGIISCIIMFITEEVSISAILDAAGPILYAGVFSCGIAYTLQIVGQQKTPPVIASLLLSLESVFSVITAWLFLHEYLSWREILGCVIVFAAIILAQLTDYKPSDNK